MSTMYDEDDTTPETDSPDETPAGLRAAVKRAEKTKAENEALKRELAFAKAGIDPDDTRMKYFVRGYDGDLTADAIKQAATEAGFIGAPQQQSEQQDFSAQQRIMNASAGAVSEDVTEQAAVARLEQAYAEGGVEAVVEVARSYGVPSNI
jgi:ribosomal protein L12E/L44/L45/RPP1/RPP2